MLSFIITIIITILAFIALIGILVAVHEFGHAWTAHRLGVKVQRFSIGFGQTLWMRHLGPDDTEFVIAAIPLGGYVKMLDEREEEVPADELHRAFNRQSLKVRTAIVVAGPLFNLLFAILAYMLVYLFGVTGMKALVGEVIPHSIADRAGFQTGYQIIAVNGQATARWDSVIQTTLEQLLNEEYGLKYSVQTPTGNQYELSLDLQNFTIDDIAEKGFLDKLGMYPFRPAAPAQITEIVPDSAAQRANLQAGDKILAVDGETIKNWDEWADYISKRPNMEITASIERNQQTLTVLIKPDNYNGQGRMGVYGPRQFDIPEQYLITERYSLWQSLTKGVFTTWEMSVLSLRVMFKMLLLEISPKNISGVISIAEYAGKTVQLGFVAFLNFLGLVSVSLAVINLLPIPLLDGGHLLLYAIEGVKGSPLTETSEYLLQRIGLVLLLSLMGLAIFNDLTRLLNS